MRSFSLFALAAAVFAPFVAAAPAPIDVHAVAGAGAKVHARAFENGLAARADIPAVAPLPVPALPVDAGSLVPRGGKRGVAAILVDLKVNVKVHTDALYALKSEDCTTDKLTVIIGAIVKVVVSATVELQALVGADLSVILAAVDGTAQVAVGVIAQLLADVLCLIFGALGFVLGIVADVKVLLNVIVGVAFGDCICGLIGAILALVDGLLAALIPLILGLVGIILALGLNVVGQLLTIC